MRQLRYIWSRICLEGQQKDESRLYQIFYFLCQLESSIMLERARNFQHGEDEWDGGGGGAENT